MGKKLIRTFIVFLLLLLTSCRFIGNDEVIEYKPDDKVILRLDVADYEDEVSRTILPAKETGSGVSKYVLHGTLAGSGENYSKTWKTYDAMKNDTLEMSIGTWTFTLSVYKKEGGTDKIFAKGTVIKTLTITEVHKLSFNLSFNANTLEYGSISVKVEVPYGTAKKADVSIYNYDVLNNKNEVLNKSYTISGGTPGGKSSFNIEGNNIKNDYYYLQMDFHTDDSGTPTATRMQTVKIAGGQTSKATITYDEDLNKKYIIRFNAQERPGEVYSIPYTTLEYNSSSKITLPTALTCTADHYEFAGWYENSSYTGLPVTTWNPGDRTGEVNLYAKWTPKSYPVAYYDFAAGQAAGKTYSGTSMASTLTYGETISKPTYDVANGALTDGNEVIFAGWYTDKDCTSASKITKYDGSADLYAKWNYKYVYLDPSETLTTGYDPLLGDDANRGYLPTEPLYTMETAKLYMKGNTIGEKVYLMSRLSIAEEGTPGASGSNAHLAKNNPSELTTPAYNNAILQRYNTYNAIHDSLVRIDGGNIVISNVTIDGGAVWGASGPAGVNSGIKADYAAIDDQAVYDSILLLTGKVIVQNNDTSESRYNNSGGGIRVTTKTQVTIDSKNVIIKNNKSKFGAGIYLLSWDTQSSTVDILKLNKGCIENNYATSNGAGIGIFYSGSYNASRDKMTVHIGAADGNPDGSDVVIKNNVAAGNGGGIFATYYTDVHINNVQITNNSSVYGAGIYAEAVTETGYTPSVITVFNAFIERNTASQNGGGLYVDYNTNGCAKYTQDFGSISYNNAVNGGGVATDATDTNVTELSDLVIKNNTASSNGGGVYVEDGRFVQLEDVIISKNKCSASGDGAGIYSVGTVKLGGEIDVSDNYRENSAVQNNIFMNNNSAARYIKLISPISPASGKTKVATIDMTASKYPIVSYDASDSSTYVKILNEDSGSGYIASSYKLFGVEKTNYVLNSAGHIYATRPMMNPNGGVSFTDDDEITFELSESRIKPDEENNIDVTITQFKNTASERILTNADFTDFAIKVYSNGREITSTAYITVDNAAQKVTVRDVPEGQNLVIHVTMKYNGKAYGGSFNMKVESDNSISLADFSAYLATLPAGEHNIPLNADMSDATNVQALAAALEAYPDRIVNLDLTSSTFTEFAGAASSTDAYFKDVINLKSVSLPATVTSINKYALCGCAGLTSIDIPSSVTEIGDDAFYYCSGLTSIDIPSSVTKFGTATFMGCTSLTSIDIPSSVTNMGNNTFRDCTSLTSITIPSSVTSLGSYLFQDCIALTSIDIPSSVTTIYSGVFQGCTAITSIDIPSSVTKMGNNTFRDCTSLTSITIPSSVTSIGVAAFQSCTGLASITIPPSVTEIGGGAFRYCSGLTSIDIPSSVTKFGAAAFRDCTSLTSITIPSSVTYIDSYAFADCNNLTSAVFEDTLSSWTINGSTFTPTNNTSANAQQLVINTSTWTKD